MTNFETAEGVNVQLRRITVSESDVECKDKRPLGSGAYGKVYTVKYRGSTCAAKEIHEILTGEASGRQKLLNAFARECCQCSALNHRNIVSFIGVYAPRRQVLPVMLMELMDVSLRVYLERTPDVALTVKGSILIDVAEGLGYLHSHNPSVVHRDLTPNNVLLKVCNGEIIPVAKISDLGVAKAVESNKLIQQGLTKIPGTPGFMPPEAFEEDPVYNTSLDMFSYGGIVLFVANQMWPDPTTANRLDPRTNKLVAFTEVQRRQKYIDEMKGGVKIWKPLVKSCLSNNPLERPTIAEVTTKLKSLKLIELQAHIRGLVIELCEEGKVNSDYEITRQFAVAWKTWMSAMATKTPCSSYPSDDEIDMEVIKILRTLLQANDELLVSKLLEQPLKERNCLLQLSVIKDTHLSSTKWFSFKSLSNDDVELAERLTKDCLVAARDHLDAVNRELKPFNSNSACEVIRSLVKFIDDVMNSNKRSGFAFTPEYKVDLALVMCAYISDLFKQNTRRLKDDDPVATLNEIKSVFLNIFKDLYKNSIITMNAKAATVSNKRNRSKTITYMFDHYIMTALMFVIIAWLFFYCM